MTTFIDFVPSQIQAPTFNVTLDGDTYAVLVTWNLAAQRYYITISSLNGGVIVTEALVGSPIGIELSAISWQSGIVTVTTSVPHNLKVGQTLNLTMTGAVPDAYNGMVQALVAGPSTFSYALAANPGSATTFGSVEQNINLVAGFFVSTLIYRQANVQFEVSP